MKKLRRLSMLLFMCLTSLAQAQTFNSVDLRLSSPSSDVRLLSYSQKYILGGWLGGLQESHPVKIEFSQHDPAITDARVEFYRKTQKVASHRLRPRKADSGAFLGYVDEFTVESHKRLGIGDFVGHFAIEATQLGPLAISCRSSEGLLYCNFSSTTGEARIVFNKPVDVSGFSLSNGIAGIDQIVVVNGAISRIVGSDVEASADVISFWSLGTPFSVNEMSSSRTVVFNRPLGKSFTDGWLKSSQNSEAEVSFRVDKHQPDNQAPAVISRVKAGRVRSLWIDNVPMLRGTVGYDFRSYHRIALQDFESGKPPQLSLRLFELNRAVDLYDLHVRPEKFGSILRFRSRSLYDILARYSDDLGPEDFRDAGRKLTVASGSTDPASEEDLAKIAGSSRACLASVLTGFLRTRRPSSQNYRSQVQLDWMFPTYSPRESPNWYEESRVLGDVRPQEFAAYLQLEKQTNLSLFKNHGIDEPSGRLLGSLFDELRAYSSHGEPLLTIGFLDYRKTKDADFEIELQERDAQGKTKTISPGRYEGEILITGSNFDDLRVPLVLDIYDRWAWFWTVFGIAASALATGLIGFISAYSLYKLQKRPKAEAPRSYVAE